MTWPHVDLPTARTATITSSKSGRNRLSQERCSRSQCRRQQPSPGLTLPLDAASDARRRRQDQTFMMSVGPAARSGVSRNVSPSAATHGQPGPRRVCSSRSRLVADLRGRHPRFKRRPGAPATWTFAYRSRFTSADSSRLTLGAGVDLRPKHPLPRRLCCADTQLRATAVIAASSESWFGRTSAPIRTARVAPARAGPRRAADGTEPVSGRS